MDGFTLSIWTPLGGVNIVVAGIVAFVLFSGMSFFFWGSVSVLRFLGECFGVGLPGKGPHAFSLRDLAVIVPAHNEEVVMERFLQNLLQIVPMEHIFVASDGSTDRTTVLARDSGCAVLDIVPGRGKAGAIVATLEHFSLFDRFPLVMILDADTQLGPGFFDIALPFFDDPEVAVFGGHAKTRWTPHWFPRWSAFFTAYRTRLYLLMQVVYRYSQTWRYTNLSAIIPGFCAIWRSEVLRQIDISAPGLVIEDFNMTFDFQRKKLGRIAYSPRAIGLSQDPHRLGDYFRQVQRWSLGLWQTVRRHGIWPGWFWVSLSVYLVETLIAGLFMLLLPAIFLALLLGSVYGYEWFSLAIPFVPLDLAFRPIDVLFGVFFFDYVATVIVAIAIRRPMLLVYGLGFLFLRFLDSVAAFLTMPQAIRLRSRGVWTSPARSAA